MNKLFLLALLALAAVCTAGPLSKLEPENELIPDAVDLPAQARAVLEKRAVAPTEKLDAGNELMPHEIDLTAHEQEKRAIIYRTIPGYGYRYYPQAGYPVYPSASAYRTYYPADYLNSYVMY